MWVQYIKKQNQNLDYVVNLVTLFLVYCEYNYYFYNAHLTEDTAKVRH